MVNSGEMWLIFSKMGVCDALLNRLLCVHSKLVNTVYSYILQNVTATFSSVVNGVVMFCVNTLSAL